MTGQCIFVLTGQTGPTSVCQSCRLSVACTATAWLPNIFTSVLTATSGVFAWSPLDRLAALSFLYALLLLQQFHVEQQPRLMNVPDNPSLYLSSYSIKF